MPKDLVEIGNRTALGRPSEDACEKWPIRHTASRLVMGQGSCEERVKSLRCVGFGPEYIACIKPGRRVTSERRFGIGVKRRPHGDRNRFAVREELTTVRLLFGPENLVPLDDPGPGEALQGS